MKQNIKKIIPIVLTVTSCVGVIVTAISSSKAGIKASKKDNIEDKVKCYIPTAAIAAGTIICIVGSRHFTKKQYAGIVGTYAILQQKFKKYQNKVKEKCGEEVHNEIVKEIVTEECNPPVIYAPGLVGNTVLIPEKLSDPEMIRTFYESYSNRYFESTLSNVLNAEFNLNRNYALGGSVSVNMLYEFLGLSKTDDGDKAVWNYDDGMYWIDFDHTLVTLDDGMEVINIEMIAPTNWDDS